MVPAQHHLPSRKVSLMIERYLLACPAGFIFESSFICACTR